MVQDQNTSPTRENEYTEATPTVTSLVTAARPHPAHGADRARTGRNRNTTNPLPHPSPGSALCRATQHYHQVTYASVS